MGGLLSTFTRRAKILSVGVTDGVDDIDKAGVGGLISEVDGEGNVDGDAGRGLGGTGYGAVKMEDNLNPSSR